MTACGLDPTSDSRSWQWLAAIAGRGCTFSVQLGSARDDDSTTVLAADLDDVGMALGGDGPAFERIVKRYQQEVARRLRRFTRDPAVLEELVHETFVQAFLSLRSFRGDAPLEHWLHRIAIRTGFRYWKRRRKYRVLSQLDAQAAAVDAPAESRIERTLDQLQPRDRLVIVLLYLEERSVAQTAMLTGWSRTMVKVQAFRARQRLRKLMEADDERN